jgi:hypothetical protein
MTTTAKTMIGSIVENPYVLSLASWAWGSDPSPLVTPPSCLESLPVLASPCLARLIAKLVGVCIILASCANKAPVIRNIVASRSVAGLSPTAIYGEMILYSNAAFYNVLGGNPFSAYGETFTVLLQTMVVAILFWIYDENDRGRRDAAFASAAYCAYLYGVFYGERDYYPIRAPTTVCGENPSFKPCQKAARPPVGWWGRRLSRGFSPPIPVSYTVGVLLRHTEFEHISESVGAGVHISEAYPR